MPLRSFSLLWVSLVSTCLAGQLTLDRVELAAAKLDELAEREVRQTGIPGTAIAIVFKDQVVFAKGFGVRIAGSMDAVDADTVFQLASLSKPLGSTVVAALVGKKLLSWDSRISDLDPAFEMWDSWVTREVTLRDFYAHRSGLPDHAGDLLEDIGFSREEILHRLRFQKPKTSFRSGFAYTNFGITEAAVAAAKAVGKEWEDLCEEILYKPLGMASTSSRYADFTARKNRALGHVKIDGKWVPKYQRDPDAQSPAGGVSSSVNDVAKWMRLQLAGGKFASESIVDQDALAETHYPTILTGFSPIDGIPGFCGLGWNVRYDATGRLELSHSGAFALGAGTSVILVPSEELGIVVLTNAAPLGVAEGLAVTFMGNALGREPKRDWLAIFKRAFAQMEQADRSHVADYSNPPTSPAPASENAAYLGRYRNDLFGEVDIVEKDDALVVVQGPKKMRFPMTHWNRDTFTYPTAGENSVGTAGIIFTIGPDGRAQRVLIENLNIHGQGAFERVPENKE